MQAIRARRTANALWTLIRPHELIRRAPPLIALVGSRLSRQHGFSSGPLRPAPVAESGDLYPGLQSELFDGVTFGTDLILGTAT